MTTIGQIPIPRGYGGERVERVSPANSGWSLKLRRFGSILALSGQNEIDFGRIEYSDPNPELEKHPMSLEASQSSRECTLYPRDIKLGPGGTPPGKGLESRGYRVDSREYCEASRLIGCFSSSGFGSCGKRMRRICFCASKNRKYKNAQNENMDVRF